MTLQNTDILEIETLPDGWEISLLSNIAENHDNKRTPIKSLDREKMKGIYPYCGANGIVDFINQYKLEGEYVLVAEDGGYWGKGENTSYIMREKFFVNNHAHILRAINGKTTNLYLHFVLNHVNINPLISGDARGKLTKSVLMNLPIPTPPLFEQQAITETLSSVQSAISKQKDLIVKLRELKYSMMHELFTRGTRGEKTKMTEFGEIPESWFTIKASDFCASVRDGTHDSPKRKDSGKMLVTSKNIIEGRIDFDSCYLISEEDFNVVNKRSKVDNNDVILSMIGTLGEVAFIDKYNNDFCIKNVGLFKNSSKEDGLWLFYWLQSNQSKAYIRSNIGGSTQKYITLASLRNFPIAIPTDSEKNLITETLCLLDQKIQIHTNKLNSLESLFKTLLHELMSGERRINT